MKKILLKLKQQQQQQKDIMVEITPKEQQREIKHEKKCEQS